MVGYGRTHDELVAGPAHRLVRIELDEANAPRRTAEAEHDRAISIYDILEDNSFSLAQFYMALGPLRRVMRDYFQVCDTYYEAIRTKSPSQIQAIDMGRRALHNEGAEILRGRLDGKVATDEMTSRRLFTLICVLQTK